MVSLTANDNMLKLERKFSGSAILGNAYTMLTQIAGTCGVELAQARRRSAPPPNAEIRASSTALLVSTWRDCVGLLPNGWPGLPPSTGWAGLRIVQFGDAPA